MKALPDEGEESPAMILRRLVLPQPDCPTMAVMEPRSNFASIPASTGRAFPLSE